MKRLSLFLLALFSFAGFGHALPLVSMPTFNQTAQSVFEFGRNPQNFVVDIPANGATSRTQLPSHETTACTIQAKSGNTGVIYVGGPTVTNASGSNEGIGLIPGGSYGAISVLNSNLIYVAADTAGDDVKVFCN